MAEQVPVKHPRVGSSPTWPSSCTSESTDKTYKTCQRFATGSGQKADDKAAAGDRLAASDFQLQRLVVLVDDHCKSAKKWLGKKLMVQRTSVQRTSVCPSLPSAEDVFALSYFCPEVSLTIHCFSFKRFMYEWLSITSRTSMVAPNFWSRN